MTLRKFQLPNENKNAPPVVFDTSTWNPSLKQDVIHEFLRANVGDLECVLCLAGHMVPVFDDRAILRHYKSTGIFCGCVEDESNIFPEEEFALGMFAQALYASLEMIYVNMDRWCYSQLLFTQQFVVLLDRISVLPAEHPQDICRWVFCCFKRLYDEPEALFAYLKENLDTWRTVEYRGEALETLIDAVGKQMETERK